jgi:hypothetical protein
MVYFYTKIIARLDQEKSGNPGAGELKSVRRKAEIRSM